MNTSMYTTIRAAPCVPFLLFYTAALLLAGDTKLVRYDATPSSSKMRIDGTVDMVLSTNEWFMESIWLSGYMEADTNFPASALTNSSAAKPILSVLIPVRSFKSGRLAMDQRMQEAMNETQFAHITYKLAELKPTSPAGSTGRLKFGAVGALTIAGTTLTNVMPVFIEKLKDGNIKIVGSTALKMSEYGIHPPTSPGLFTNRDEVRLTYEWLIAPQSGFGNSVPSTR